MQTQKIKTLPTALQLKTELDRINHKKEFHKVLKGTIISLLAVAAISVLISVLFIPVLKVTGSSMEPTLADDQYVLCLNNQKYKTGDVIAFYYNNKILLKRVIAGPGDVVDISEDGTVSVNGNIISEPYITNKSKGKCDIELPYQVPENRIFVMGDHRSESVDSRSEVIGCISKKDIVGKVIFRIYPLDETGKIK